MGPPFPATFSIGAPSDNEDAAWEASDRPQRKMYLVLSSGDGVLASRLFASLGVVRPRRSVLSACVLIASRSQGPPVRVVESRSSEGSARRSGVCGSRVPAGSMPVYARALLFPFVLPSDAFCARVRSRVYLSQPDSVGRQSDARARLFSFDLSL